ncbi:MAG TPA: ABC transporter permease [Trueperaceae bacterium]
MSRAAALPATPWRLRVREHPYLVSLVLLAVAVLLNYLLQDNLFQLRVVNGNLRVMLPLMVLAAGQALVIVGGGIDLSVGATVSLVNVILVTLVTPESSWDGVLLGALAGLAAGALAGAVNGFCVAYLRLQPIVTTYATSFLYFGLALAILPRPGGALPRALTSFYRSAPLGLPATAYGVALLLLVWLLLRRTRFVQHLYAVGGREASARSSGVAVTRVRFLSYVLMGVFAAFAAMALTLSTGSGNARLGDAMTLSSIVAVVLGGTRLSGGQGGVTGAVVGVALLTVIRNLITFANVPTWYQTLVDALVILLALAGPGLVRLVRRGA